MNDRDSTRWLLAVDAGLVLSVFAVPFAYGGRHSIGETLLVFAAVWSSLVWALFQMFHTQPSWIRTRVEPILLAFLAVGILQVIRLPQALLAWLSPSTVDVLPLWSSSDATSPFSGPWPYLSLSVSETTPRIAIGLAYVLLFYVTAQRVRSLDDAGRVLKWIASAGAAMALFGFLQFFFSNGLYYWVIDLPQGTMSDRLKGAFLNKNHFAQFVALSIGPLTWWLVSRTEERADERPQKFNETQRRRIPRAVTTGFLIVSVGLVSTAVLVSRSRGAFVSVGVSCAVMVLALYARSLISRRLLAGVAGAGAVGLLVLAILGHRELGRVAERLENWDNNGRFDIWQANLDVFQEFLLVGTGLGSHLDIHQRHLDTPFAIGQYSHAESGFLQIATETGIVGLVVAAICLTLCIYWCGYGVRMSQDRRATLLLCAALCSLMISSLQSVADFVWYVPGCVVPALLQMACACRVFQIERDRQRPKSRPREILLPRPVFAVVVILVLPIGGWMASQWLPRLQAQAHWTNYRKVILSGKTGKDISRDINVVSDSRWPVLQQVLRDLRAAVRLNSNDSRVHTRLAVQYTRLFHLLQKESDAALPLNQIRDAAENGGFESHEEVVEWLHRAFGDNMKYAFAAAKHAHRAIELNPIDGIAWLYLSELSFLLDSPPGYDRKCIAQSLELRPYNAQVLYAAGRDARLDGDVEQWVEYWKMAFQRDEDIQLEIIRSMAEWTPAPVEIVVKAFEPDIDAVERMIDVLKELGQKQNQLKAIAFLANQLTERAQVPDNRNRSDDWRRAAVAFAQTGAHDQVESSFRSSLTAAPTNFRAHLEFGIWLMNQGRATESVEQLQWCQRFAPQNEQVQQLAAELTRRSRRNRNVRQVSAESHSTSG